MEDGKLARSALGNHLLTESKRADLSQLEAQVQEHMNAYTLQAIGGKGPRSIMEAFGDMSKLPGADVHPVTKPSLDSLQ